MRVAEVAAETGMPKAEVRLMVVGFWDGAGGSSPIETRVACLRRYWGEFEAVHDQQRSGMATLWGFVSE